MFESIYTLPSDLSALVELTPQSESSAPSMSRLHWLFWLSALGFAWISWLRFGRREISPGRWGFFRFLFPSTIWKHASTWVDIKVWLFTALFRPLTFSLKVTLAVFVAGYVSMGLSALAAPGLLDPGSVTVQMVLFTIAFVLMSDLGTYIIHRASHEIPMLWAFHKVHHSAETLTPFTLQRKHPGYSVASAILNGPLIGLLHGISLWAFGVSPEFWVLLGGHAVIGLFNFMGANLRHSHIWFSWGPALSRIFISPAQHQIHHSRHVRHHDRNYGEIFAIWDWMFGSLYVPKDREQLEFGLADSDGNPLPQPHPSLILAMWEPLRAFVACFRRDPEPAPDETPARGA